MTDEEIADYIVTQIGKHRQRSDIAIEVCELTGMDYREAQKLVYQVAYEKRKAIAARQSPLMVIFGVGFLLVGVVLLFIYLVLPLIAVASGTNYIPRPSSIYYIGMGFALVFAGILGLWQTIRQFFE